MITKKINGKEPVYGENCFFTETSVIVGDVVMGNNCTVWYHAVIRGDVNSIIIGDFTNVQDGAVIHCTYKKAATKIGNKVSIGHNAIVHGCTIEDEVLIGMGSIVMDGAVIGKGSVIAAGSVVLANTIVEQNSVYAGIPAKKVKDTTNMHREVIEKTANNYPMYAEWFKDK
ncbi:MAG: gamma carbonic anhydrase family protein [Cyclobacteriaceae bacterium]|nr:gamma carbonic anhydrase family protein [Cyclobacteriaceae bacterium]